MPTYNSSWSLQPALDAIEKLNYPKNRIRIVFVDNNSKDETLRMLKDFQKRFESDYESIIIISGRKRGSLGDGLSSCLSSVTFLAKIEEVYAVGSEVKYPVYDEFAVPLRTPGRSYGIMEVSFVAKELEALYEIDCSDGKQVHIDRKYDYLLEKSGYKRIPFSGLFTDERRLLGKWVRKVRVLRKTKLPSIYSVSHFYLIKSYMESLENGSFPPVQPEEGKEAIKLVECIEESLDKHQAVPIK